MPNHKDSSTHLCVCGRKDTKCRDCRKLHHLFVVSPPCNQEIYHAFCRYYIQAQEPSLEKAEDAASEIIDEAILAGGRICHHHICASKRVVLESLPQRAMEVILVSTVFCLYNCFSKLQMVIWYMSVIWPNQRVVMWLLTCRDLRWTTFGGVEVVPVPMASLSLSTMVIHKKGWGTRKNWFRAENRYSTKQPYGSLNIWNSHRPVLCLFALTSSNRWRRSTCIGVNRLGKKPYPLEAEPKWFSDEGDGRFCTGNLWSRRFYRGGFNSLMIQGLFWGYQRLSITKKSGLHLDFCTTYV